MKLIAGAILIVAASIFYHTRTELEAERSSIDGRVRSEMIRNCRFAAIGSGLTGLLFIGVGLLIPEGRTRATPDQKDE